MAPPPVSLLQQALEQALHSTGREHSRAWLLLLRLLLSVPIPAALTTLRSLCTPILPLNLGLETASLSYTSSVAEQAGVSRNTLEGEFT